MQSDVLTDEYIKKLNGIIEIFKCQQEWWMYIHTLGLKDHKFYSNISLSIFAVAISIFAIVISIFNTLKIIILPMLLYGLILVMLFILAFMLIIDSIYKKRIKNLTDELTPYTTTIGYLEIYKMLPYEVNLSKLIIITKKRYIRTGHIRTDQILDNEIWFKELFDCLDEINKEILEKENTISLSK
jgi:hypothetical protein